MTGFELCIAKVNKEDFDSARENESKLLDMIVESQVIQDFAVFPDDEDVVEGEYDFYDYLEDNKIKYPGLPIKKDFILPKPKSDEISIGVEICHTGSFINSNTTETIELKRCSAFLYETYEIIAPKDFFDIDAVTAVVIDDQIVEVSFSPEKEISKRFFFVNKEGLYEELNEDA